MKLNVFDGKGVVMVFDEEWLGGPNVVQEDLTCPCPNSKRHPVLESEGRDGGHPTNSTISFQNKNRIKYGKDEELRNKLV